MNKIAPNGYRLGINTGFAVNRYSEPEEWVRIVGDELGLNMVQFTADMLNVDLPSSIVYKQLNRIQKACELYNVEISSTFTGAFTRVNHLAHPDPDIRKHWVGWFKRFVDLSVDLGCKSMGSHFGIFTHLDNNNLEYRSTRRQQNIDGWHEVANYAKNRGLDYISWEPMSISREQGETISEARKLHTDVNFGSPLPFKMCLDVDHGDLSSLDPRNTDPYEWLDEFASESPLIHLKQSASLKQIAEARGLSVGTIAGHLIKIRKDHPDENLNFYKPKAAVLKKVKAAYDEQPKSAPISLNAIYSKLEGKESYDDIKLAVAFID